MQGDSVSAHRVTVR